MEGAKLAFHLSRLKGIALQDHFKGECLKGKSFKSPQLGNGFLGSMEKRFPRFSQEGSQKTMQL